MKADVAPMDAPGGATTGGAGAPSPVHRIIIWAFALSGAAALIYEVTWTRELSLVFGSTVYAVSIMLAAFMSGLSLGGFLGGKWADGSRSLTWVFARLELGVAIMGLLTIPLIRAMPAVYFYLYTALRPPFALFFILQLLLSFLVMLGPTVLMGATFPVVAKMNSCSYRDLGQSIGNVYSVNTLGSIAGSLAAGFLLIPVLGVRQSVMVAAGLNLVVSLTIMYSTRTWPGRRELLAAGAVVMALGGVGLAMGDPADALGFYRFNATPTYESYRRAAQGMSTLYQDDGVYSRVAVLRSGDGQVTLENGGMIEGSNGVIDARTTHLLTWLPAATATEPKTALVIGLGTGYTSRAMLETDVERVDTIEINPSVVEASTFFVGDQLEADPRWHLYVDDARGHLARSPRLYDVITSEPSWPLSDGVAHLFTREFFELGRARLTPDGVYCQWLPRYLLSRNDFMMMYKTFHDVFPNTTVWAVDVTGKGGSDDMMLIGVNGTRSVDTTAVAETVRNALEQQGLKDVPFHLFGSRATMAQSLSDPSIPFNTDDRPLLEFNAVRNVITRFSESAHAATLE